MKKNTFFSALLSIIAVGVNYSAFGQNVGINTAGSLPSINAILDLNTGNSNNVGLIIPNVTLAASLTSFNPPMANGFTPGDKGMIVYNSSAANQPIGVYYWNGANWVSLGGAAATVTAANDGTSLNGTTVNFGGAYNS
ncbi:MAG TPA: hypothetical protein VK808_08360, partial [Bacteroidia bacterium]|nr:hypothetical protein [Bacteroidia bacterium]